MCMVPTGEPAGLRPRKSLSEPLGFYGGMEGAAPLGELLQISGYLLHDLLWTPLDLGVPEL